MAEPSVLQLLPYTVGGITLRRLAERDLSAFQAYRHDPEVGRFQGWQPWSDADASHFLREMNRVPLFRPGVWCQVGVSEQGRPDLIGDLGLRLAEDEQQVELGVTFQRASQGRGRATAAVVGAIGLVFAATKAERVVCVTDARNEACVRLLERVGMERTGTASAIFRGEPCEEHHYVLTRSAALRVGLSTR